MTSEFGVAYYGVMVPERAERDFAEMREQGINAVLLGVGEFDAWFWRRSIPRLVEAAKSQGLTVYIDLWGWGKVFGGEPPSIFLQEHVGHRQVTSEGRVLPAACMNSREFRAYVYGKAEELARETRADYFFLDEPHFSFRVEKGGLGARREWACRCRRCRSLFMERYGYEMPRRLNRDVLEFRQSTIVSFLRGLAKAIKRGDPRKKVAVCLLPTAKLGGLTDLAMRTYRELVGIADWGRIAEIPEIDTLSTDPYWILVEKSMPIKALFRGLRWYGKVVDRLLALSKRHGKESQVWIQAFNVPAGREKEIVRGIELAVEKGVDSVFVWPYKAGRHSVLESERADLLWSMITDAFRRYSARSRSP